MHSFVAVIRQNTTSPLLTQGMSPFQYPAKESKRNFEIAFISAFAA